MAAGEQLNLKQMIVGGAGHKAVIQRRMLAARHLMVICIGAVLFLVANQPAVLHNNRQQGQDQYPNITGEQD